MKVIKDCEKICLQYVDELRNWIVENQRTYFRNKDFKAYSWQDFDHFYKHGSMKKVSRRELVMPGEPLIIDRDYGGVHAYVICTITGQKRKQVNHLYHLIDIADLEPDVWRNGYFLVPNIKILPPYQ